MGQAWVSFQQYEFLAGFLSYFLLCGWVLLLRRQAGSCAVIKVVIISGTAPHRTILAATKVSVRDMA